MKKIIERLRQIADEMERGEWSKCDVAIAVFRDQETGILTIYPLGADMLDAEKHDVLKEASENYNEGVVN